MKRLSCFILFILFIFPQIFFANVRLNALFADHMVIQRSTQMPVWGWADPMEKISIETSWGAKAETVAGIDSTWMVKIKTPKAGGPFQMIISGKDTIVINDILSGEVWLCAGQSNMDFALSKMINDARESKYQPLVEYIREEVAQANDSLLRHIEIPQTTSLYTTKKNFKAIWRSATKGEVDKITATGYFFAKELRQKLNVPVGLVECSWGGTRIQPWISAQTYKSDKELQAFFEKEQVRIKSLIEEMDKEDYVDTAYQRKLKEYEADKENVRRPWPNEHPLKSKQMPATLYNGMLSAVIPYAIKGAIWYQGESNSHYLEHEYEKYFRALITSWRAEWGQGDFPFYWAQLAAYHVPDDRSDMGWAMVNDYLRRSLVLPNTGMAVLYDIGEAKDVHPHNKMDAGKRLALWALKNDYNIRVNAFSGPLYKSAKTVGNKIVVTFDHACSGLMAGSKELNKDTKAVNVPLTWFEIAGKDGIWKPAQARIMAKNKIEVYNTSIENPVKVRYAWSSNPEGANLYNKEGLPAAVFTTDISAL